MIKARGGDVPLPPGNGGGWSFDEAGQLSQSAKVVYDLVAKPIHPPKDAIIATLSQEESCDNHHCVGDTTCFHGNMDVEQLKKLMVENGDTQVGLAKLVGISPDKLSKVLHGKRSLKLHEANILRAYYGLDKPKEAPAMLPIVGLISAGSWQEGFPSVRGYMPSPDQRLSADSFVVIVEGDSMNLVAEEGEGIIVDPRDTNLVDKGYYVVRNESGEMTFKQYREGPARLEPCSTNSDHKIIHPGREIFTVVGRAKKRVSDL